MSSVSVPLTMSAWRFHALGGALSLDRDVATPTAADDEILVKVQAVGLNPVDWKMIDYNFLGAALPQSVGYDVAGEVVRVGSSADAAKFQVGDRVVFGVDLRKVGGLTQYTAVVAVRAVRIPCCVSYIQAASFPVAFLSAFDALAHLHLNGKTVFIPGGAGGVAHFAVQIAQRSGAARVIASAGRPDSLYTIRDVLKVTNAINYAKEDVVASVLALTNGEGVDVVFDATYLPSSFAQSAKVLKKGGVLSILGSTPSEEILNLVKGRGGSYEQSDLVRYVGPKISDLLRIYHDGLQQGMEWAQQGKVTPIISKVVSFDVAGSAVTELRQNKNIGKVVVSLE